MANIKKTAAFAGLGLAVVFGLNQGVGWAGIPGNSPRQSQTATITEPGDQVPVILARGGGGGGSGNGGRGGDNSGSGSGYGAKDGSGSAPRPQDGTGYGAKNGSGSGDCDGSGPKGKGGNSQTN